MYYEYSLELLMAWGEGGGGGLGCTESSFISILGYDPAKGQVMWMDGVEKGQPLT